MRQHFRGVVLPLGNGFTISAGKTLLVGGGVGVAPLLYAGKAIKELGGTMPEEDEHLRAHRASIRVLRPLCGPVQPDL